MNGETWTYREIIHESHIARFFFIYYWVCANAMNQWDAINGIVIFQHEHRTLLKVDLPDVTIHSLFRCWTKQRARYRYIQHWILLEYSLHSYVVQNPQATHTILTSHKRIAEMRKKYGQLMVKWHTKSRHIVAFFLQFLICISCLQSFFFLMVMNAFFRLCMNIFVNIIEIVNVVFIESSSFASKSMDSYRMFIFFCEEKEIKRKVSET